MKCKAAVIHGVELITNRYPLADINEGYRAMRDGENIRGIVAHA